MSIPFRVRVTSDGDDLGDSKSDPLLEERRGSMDSRKKVTLAQRLTPKFIFSKNSKSGDRSPAEVTSTLHLPFDDLKQFRSRSVDLGKTSKSPLQSQSKKMFLSGYNDETSALNDADREVQSIVDFKPQAPPPGTVEYTTSATDSLASIAAKHKSTTSELIKINKMMSPLVFPGKKIFVPTEDYVPLDYSSQLASPRVSPKPRAGSVDELEVGRLKSKDAEESKKSKKSRLKDRRPSDVLIKSWKNLTQKNSSVFKARVDYVTGRQDPLVPGTLEISRSDVKFEPDGVENVKGVMKDIVKYRMALGKAMISANVLDSNPYSVKRRGSDDQVLESGNTEVEESEKSKKNKGEEKKANGKNVSQNTDQENANSGQVKEKEEMDKNEEVVVVVVEENKLSPTKTSKDEDKLNDSETGPEAIQSTESKSSSVSSSSSSDSPLEVKYLLVKLGIPSQAIKERPTISSLIRTSLPVNVTTTVEHCFAVSESIVPELIEFLQTNYSDAYGRTETESSDRFEALDELIRKQPPPSERRRVRRTLSVAELCNLPLPEMSRESSILTETHIRILREHLLASSDCRPWRLVYGTNVHGFSINTLYRTMLKTDLVTMLVIHDMSDKVFGAMMTNSIRQSEGFYGNGETFLFTFHPVFKKFCWSGKNSYFMKGNPDNFYIGASDGIFGLWIHDDLNHGRSQRCETFDNDILTETSEDFYIKCIEVWQFPFSLDE